MFPECSLQVPATYLVYVWEAGVFQSRWRYEFQVSAGNPNAATSFITGCADPDTTARQGEMCTQTTVGETTVFQVSSLVLRVLLFNMFCIISPQAKLSLLMARLLAS
jgi:hypothetical protein